MINFDDLIKYENENTSLDFKAIQYKKGQHEDLIKDIMSMANADVENDRYIIIGVSHKSSGDREILNIKKGDFIDSAIYQQIIRENIEPDIKLDYSPYKYKSKLLGIFKISGCSDKPYTMKKDFGKLKKGDSFIRKGTHEPRMTRRDLDIIIEKKIKKDKFDGKIQLSFSKYGSSQEIELMANSDKKLPSQRAAEKIKKIIKEKKQLAEMKTQSTAFTGISAAILEMQQRLAKSTRITANPFVPIPYEQRTLEELQKNLKEVDQTYRDDDFYELFELSSHKINISILNEGHTYIEDASIQLQIKRIEGLLIADKVYEKPKNGINRFVSARVRLYESMNYPEVDYTESSIVIYQTIGDVKHHLFIDAFRVPIRIVFLDQLAGKVIEIKCKIFGKNLIEPLTETLKIKIISPESG
ncbi:MAG: ATP-binding protein [Candidatus Atribacteria bacterium]|nr:ATP-binding protein [Candidatus Atribacteria bacterium]